MGQWDKIITWGAVVIKGIILMERAINELTGLYCSGMVHPEDLNRVQWEINEQIQYSDRKMDFICYRIITKDGKERWVEDCGHLENTGSGEDEKLFYVFISDITDTIPESRKNMIKRKNSNYNK